MTIAVGASVVFPGRAYLRLSPTPVPLVWCVRQMCSFQGLGCPSHFLRSQSAARGEQKFPNFGCTTLVGALLKQLLTSIRPSPTVTGDNGRVLRRRNRI
jgi:hypothetical protein